MKPGEAVQRRSGPLHRGLRMAWARPRFLIAAGFGVAVTLALLPWPWRPATRVLAGWDAGLVVYLVLAARLMWDCDATRIRLRAALQDEGRFTFLGLVVASALASLVAIVAELSSAHREGGHLAFAVVTILLSWVFLHTIFALHYAHEYYAEHRSKKVAAHVAGNDAGKTVRGSGLNFPDETTPDYWDFVYFSFVIGMTSQVSDVAVTSRPLRRLVAAHGVVSFIFNVTLLALMVNIAAGAI